MCKICGLSLQIDPAIIVNNLVVQLHCTELEECGSWDAFSADHFKHTSVMNSTGCLIPSYYVAVASVAAQCACSCRHIKGTFSFLYCYEINNSNMTLWPTGIVSFLLIWYDLVFAGDGSFLVPSNYFTVKIHKNKWPQRQQNWFYFP